MGEGAWGWVAAGFTLTYGALAAYLVSLRVRLRAARRQRHTLQRRSTPP
jgi:hypothetical protein